MRCSPVQHRSTVRHDACPRTGMIVRGRLHLWQPGSVGFDQGLQSCKPHSLRLKTQVRARFSGYVKAEEKYLLSTFAPEYLQFKYPELSAEEAAKQLKRDVKMACATYLCSKLKIVKSEAGASEGEVFVEFRYESIKRGVDKRTNNKNQRMKTPPPEKNIDGSIKIGKTHERSRFVMEGPTWKFASYELLEFPDWLQEAKDAEVKAAGAKAGTDKEPVPAPA